MKVIELNQLKRMAKKKENQNYKFRTWLKCHADEEELDAHFKRLHEKYFSFYDCSKCRNCCKKYPGTIPEWDLEEDAAFLGMTVEEFKDRFLDACEESFSYDTKHCPCDFFVDGDCILREYKPESCKEFPHTDKENRIGSLLSIVSNASVCPVVYEILEELKRIYHFH